MSLKNLFGGLMLAFGLLAAAPQPAHAVMASSDLTFNFRGLCEDCSSTAGSDEFGTGALTVTGVAGQTSFGSDSFVSFDYSSNLVGSIHITSPAFLDANFTVLPGANDVTISTNTFFFQSFADGSWCLGDSCERAADFGDTHVWAGAPGVVPEPMSLALLGSGLVGLMAVRRRQT